MRPAVDTPPNTPKVKQPLLQSVRTAIGQTQRTLAELKALERRLEQDEREKTGTTPPVLEKTA